MGNEVKEIGRREVGGKIFEAKKGAEKSLSRGRRCVFDSSQNSLNNFVFNWWKRMCFQFIPTTA
jgi:hypothetical protein